MERTRKVDDRTDGVHDVIRPIFDGRTKAIVSFIMSLVNVSLSVLVHCISLSSFFRQVGGGVLRTICLKI